MGSVVELQRFPGESWWGGAVGDGDVMPFGQEAFGRDLGGWLGHNQGSPLLLSSAGRYVWCDEPFRFVFDGPLIRVECETGELTTGREGASLREAFTAAAARHFPPSGTYPDSALFARPQYNTWIELVYEQTQERILEYAKGIVAHGFPPGVLMIDDNWQEDYGVWRFHPSRFPDPAGLVEQLHELGFPVMLWVCPFVSPDSATFRDLERQGLLVRTVDGGTAIRKWWNGYSGLLDTTNDDAVAWLHSRLDELRDAYGVDGFKFDAGDPRFYGTGDRTARPTHPNGMCESWARAGVRYRFNEYRACWRMQGQPLGQRLTDTEPHWGVKGLASLIPWGLAQGLVGYAYGCPDMIGGGLAEDFEQPGYSFDAELFVRWAQCSALFPMMQFSLAPWRVLDDAHLEHCLAAARLHADLGEEILRLVEHAARTGEPVQRHLEYVYPGHGYAAVNDQFLLGDDILVAPVTVKGARSRTIAFPPGTWHGDDGSTVEGPTTETIEAPLSRLPWYRR